MNQHPTPQRPDDDASDPLLTALRQRLGDYGEVPPPGAWAGIRARLPAPVAARPWWRRPRRLLPLLALLAGLVLTGSFVRHWAVSSAATATSPTAAGGPVWPRAPLAPVGQRTVSPQDTQSAIPGSLLSKAPQPTPATSSAEAEKLDNQFNITPKHNFQPRESRGDFSASNANTQAAGQATAPRRAGPEAAQLAALSHRLPPKTRGALPAAAGAYRPVAAGGGPGAARREQRVALAGATPQPAKRYLAAAGTARHRTGRATTAGPRPAGSAQPAAVDSPPTNSAKSFATPANTTTSRRGGAGWRKGYLALVQARQAHGGGKHRKPNQPPATGTMAVAPAISTVGAPPRRLAEQVLGLAALATRPAGLALPPTAALPAPLASRPDAPRLFWPMRRWSVLALVGPTLSYRTIGTAAGATKPDFAHLERPAVGLGAQVQVRRVLTGRWALAAGVGYHEYATRLALQVGDTLHLSQRDTYRLLTLPVQLSYALGAPRGRLAHALLVGAEPGRYLGGRSTEGSSCNCQQQTYTAAHNPYRPWSLALSLGLDLRYHLGGPASRWQWVTQATGRYVLTPFVAPDSVRLAPRHPFSVGVSTGISWDIR